MKTRRCTLNLIPSDYFDKEKTPPGCRRYRGLLHRILTHLSRGIHLGAPRGVEIGELTGPAERRQAATPDVTRTMPAMRRSRIATPCEFANLQLWTGLLPI
jgi:hypothetical protein